MHEKIDERFMRRALELASRGRGLVHPNPMVGAVLARRGRILAEGWHRRFGGPHAEVEAFKKFPAAPAGSTLYVTLEPCSHYGKTPPCADFLIRKKIRRVVAGTRDVHPAVSGCGFRRLKRAGIRVTEGVLEEEARDLNRDFNHWARRRAPYVTVKTGQSLDGAIATASGESRWITSPASRRLAMEIRAQADAILVGVNTILRDDPRLSVRLPGYKGRQPLKIVLDPHLRTPRNAKILSSQSGIETQNFASLLVISNRFPASKRRAFQGKTEILALPTDRQGRFSWKSLLKILGKRGIVHVLVEGGGETIGSAFDAGVVNEVHAFVAPAVLGGARAVRAVAGRGAARLRSAARFKRVRIERVGNDVHYAGIL